MGGNKKPRKRYDPNRVARRAIAAENRRLDGNPLLAEQQQDLGVAVWSSFDTMTRGHGTEYAWSALADTVNIALILCEKGIGTDHIDSIFAAQDALMRSRTRAYRARAVGQPEAWAFDGDGLQDMRRALELHDQQVKLSYRGELREAIEEVHRRVERGQTFAEAA